MVAALVIRKAAKSVLILEKTDLVGGTTARSGGVMWIPNNSLLKRKGIDDRFNRSVLYLDSLVGDHNDTPGATPERQQHWSSFVWGYVAAHHALGRA